MRKLLSKALAMSLSAAMISGSLMGCGTNSATETKTTDTETVEETQTAETNADAAPGESATISYWSWLPTTVQWDAMVEAFEKENPNIKIEFTRTEQSDYFEKLQVAMASGTGPDIFGLTTGAMVDQYSPFCEPMDTLADQYMPNWKDDISIIPVEQCKTSEGMLAGMPLLVAGMTDLLYNQSILDECGITEVPRTYEELKTDAELIKEKGYIPVAVGASDDWINADWFVNISNEFEEGAVYEAEDGDRSWTDQCFVDTMDAWKKMFEDGIFEDGALGVVTYPDARDQYFFNKKAAFFLTGSWHLGPTSTTNEEIKGTAVEKDTIGMCAFPAMSNTGKIYSTAGVDIMISVNKDCVNKEAAMKFVEFMSNGNGQQMWINELQGSPVSKKITYQGVVNGELQQQSIDEVNGYVNNAIGARKLNNSELETAIIVAMQNVAAGADSATELKEVQAIADNLK